MCFGSRSLFAGSIQVSGGEGSGEFGTLNLDWVGVIDNGEGDDWPHGPSGNLRHYIWDKGPIPSEPWYADEGEGRGGVIKGPSSGKAWGKAWSDEWLDGDKKDFKSEGFRLFNWRHEEDSVLLLIYESDSDCLCKWACIPRAEDILFYATISRQALLQNNGSLDYVSRRKASDDAIDNASNRDGFSDWAAPYEEGRDYPSMVVKVSYGI